MLCLKENVLVGPPSLPENLDCFGSEAPSSVSALMRALRGSWTATVAV